MSTIYFVKEKKNEKNDLKNECCVLCSGSHCNTNEIKKKERFKNDFK